MNLAERMLALGPRPVVLIDGTSGSGKTTLADAIARRVAAAHPTLIHLDDVYPGWAGLDAARRTVARIVPAHLMGAAGTWRRYDWIAERLVETRTVDPDHPLIIEGCGAFALPGLPWPALRIWLDAPEPLRRERALSREPGFASHWDEWERATQRYVETVRPRIWADVVLGSADD